MWRCGDPVAVLVDCQFGRLAFASGVVPPTVAPPCMTFIRRIDLSHLLVALFSVAGVTAVYATWLRVTNHTTVAVSYLLVVLFVAASSPLWVAIVTSIAAMLAFNFFFFPPVGTFTIADPQNWIALFAFLAVSLVASRLSAACPRPATRSVEPTRRTGPPVRSESRYPADDGARHGGDQRSLPVIISSRFQLDYVSVCLPAGTGFERFEAGALDLGHLLTTDELRRDAVRNRSRHRI